MVQPLLDACSIKKNDYQVAVLALFLSPRTVPNMACLGPCLSGSVVNVERCYLILLHLVVGVSSSV